MIDAFWFKQSLYLYFLGAWRWWCFYCCSCWWEFVRIWKGKTQMSREKIALWFILRIFIVNWAAKLYTFYFLVQNKDGAGDSSFPIIKDQTQFSVAHARYSKVWVLWSFGFLTNAEMLLIYVFWPYSFIWCCS